MGATGAARRHQAAVNFFHQGMLYTSTLGVPLIQHRVDKLMDHCILTPAPFPWPILIAVPNKEYKPWEHKGAWICCTPGEAKHAFLHAIARDVAKKDASAIKNVAPPCAHSDGPV